MLAVATPAPTASPPAPPPTAVRSPQLDALLERHRRALGHMQSESASWSGVITQDGADTPFSESADGDGRWKSSLTLPFGQHVDGNDLAVQWVQDLNGNVTFIPITRRRSLLARLLGFNAVLLDPDIAWVIDGPLTIDGRPVIRLHAKLGTADAVVYLDSQTALVNGAQLGDRAIRYVQYQTFDQLVVPTKIVETQQDEQVATTIRSVTFPPLAAADFAPPPPRRPQFPSGATEVGLDFESPHSLIVVHAKVNGTLVNFLLDSGSSASLIDQDEARVLKLPTAGSVRVVGATVLRGTVARADVLELGGVRFTPFVLEAVPLGLPASLRGFGITGILGYDVFAQVVARIDYGRAHIRLIQPSTFSYNGTGAVLALDASSRLPRVPATLGEQDPTTFTVDTGSDSGLTLYQDFAQSHARDFLRPGDLASEESSYPQSPQNPQPPSTPDPASFFGDLMQASGAGGAIHVKTAYITRLNLGKFSVDRVFTEIVLNPSGAFTPATSDGLLGASVLSKFGAVFLDYPGGRFILER